MKNNIILQNNRLQPLALAVHQPKLHTTEGIFEDFARIFFNAYGRWKSLLTLS